MGIFDFFKKNRHKECRNNQHTTEVMEDEEEEADLWAQAYMAKPHCYTKEGEEAHPEFCRDGGDKHHSADVPQRAVQER